MFYDRLKAMCEGAGTTVTAFATEVLQTSGSTAANWKKGASPNSSFVVIAAKHFGVSTDFLLGLSDNPASRENCDGAPLLSEDEHFYIEKLRQCDLGTRQRVMISGLVVMGCSPERDQLPSLRAGSRRSGSQGPPDREDVELGSIG